VKGFIICSLQEISLGRSEIRENEMGCTCNMHGEMRNAYKILGEKPEGIT
jgi:hypothetical protein